jgi:hypothetical protein
LLPIELTQTRQNKTKLEFVIQGVFGNVGEEKDNLGQTSSVDLVPTK